MRHIMAKHKAHIRQPCFIKAGFISKLHFLFTYKYSLLSTEFQIKSSILHFVRRGTVCLASYRIFFSKHN